MSRSGSPVRCAPILEVASPDCQSLLSFDLKLHPKSKRIMQFRILAPFSASSIAIGSLFPRKTAAAHGQRSDWSRYVAQHPEFGFRQSEKRPPAQAAFPDT